MKNKTHGELAGGDNVYRTKNYIVSQQIRTEKDGTRTTTDIYHRRTPERDRQFSTYGGNKQNPNGIRVAVKQTGVLFRE
jgi:hypothetical protein